MIKLTFSLAFQSPLAWTSPLPADPALVRATAAIATTSTKPVGRLFVVATSSRRGDALSSAFLLSSPVPSASINVAVNSINLRMPYIFPEPLTLRV